MKIRKRFNPMINNLLRKLSNKEIIFFIKLFYNEALLINGFVV